jgi:16S rRNA (adenine1518-N6/adenine1519-N6)-dimethyltransferase
MAKKSLGQHWLNDRKALDSIIDSAKIEPGDTILEVGPGLGSLTRKLVEQARKVIAVEIDAELVTRLQAEIRADNLEVIETSILDFDLSKLPKGYKVVANIPYYLTGKLIRLLTGSPNPPKTIVLLLQKEVAERIVAGPGKMNLLALSVQLNYEPVLGIEVPAKLFSPPPEVDSQVVILNRLTVPRFNDIDEQLFFRIAKAGFGEKRKKLRSSLSGGLGLEKDVADGLLEKAGIDADARAQELTLEQWHKLTSSYQTL